MIENLPPPPESFAQPAPLYEQEVVVSFGEEDDKNPITEDDFDTLVFNIESNEEPFAKELQDFVDGYMVAHGYDAQLTVVFGTNKNAEMSVVLTGKTSDVEKKIEEAISDRTKGSVALDIANKSLSDIIGTKVVVNTAAGSVTVTITTVTLELSTTSSGNDAPSNIGSRTFTESSLSQTRPTNTQATETPRSTRAPENQNGDIIIDLENPVDRLSIETGKNVVVNGVIFEVTNGGLKIKIDDGTYISVRGNTLHLLTPEEKAAYELLADLYFITFSNTTMNLVSISNE